MGQPHRYAVMNMNKECIACLLHQATRALEITGTGNQLAPLQKVLRHLGESSLQRPAPLLAREIQEILERELHTEDIYKAIKIDSTRKAEQILARTKNMYHTIDPFEKALRLAIAGNIIDYGIPGFGESPDVEASLHEAMEAPLDQTLVEKLRQAAEGDNSILFILDNAGEHIFDTALLRFFQPHKVTVAARGGAALNDVTMDLLEQHGDFSRYQCITTGDSTPGIDLERSGRAFKQALQATDIIILKGQGNLETMYDLDLSHTLSPGTELFFLFKVKCNMVAEKTGKPKGTIQILSRRI